MGRKIIVSDLHIDTWTNKRIGSPAKSRADHFFDFLDRIEDTTSAENEDLRVNEFLINGDLMDFPPYKTLHTFTSADSISVQVLNRLLDFATRIPVTYIFGNHDAGLSGIRALAENSVLPLNNFKINLCYPSYVISFPEKNSAILLEHGHFFDPFIDLYEMNIVKRTYGSNLQGKYRWSMNEKPVSPSPLLERPGRLEAISIQPGKSFYEAVKDDDDSYPAKSMTNLVHDVVHLGISGGQKHIWRKGAELNIGRYIRSGIIRSPRFVTQIFGHTHRADEKKFLRGGIECRYYNSGTWEQKDDQQSCSYIDVDVNGNVWMHDWVADGDVLKNL